MQNGPPVSSRKKKSVKRETLQTNTEIILGIISYINISKSEDFKSKFRTSQKLSLDIW